MSNFENVIYEKKNSIAYLTLNRPDKLNAMDEATRIEIGEACFMANDDEDVKVIVVRGSGRCFSSGWDISPGTRQEKVFFPKLRKGREREAWDLTINRMNVGRDHIFWQALWDNMKPSIAQIHGYCLAAGCLLMAMCDLAIASEDAIFGYPAARFGGVGPFYAQPWYLGLRKSKELCYTGWMIDAREALQFGWLNKIVPRDQLDDEVELWADTISQMPPMVAYFSKVTINTFYEQMGVESILKLRGTLSAVSEASTLPGSTKWAEKRRQEVGLKTYLEERDAPFKRVDNIIRERLGLRKK